MFGKEPESTQEPDSKQMSIVAQGCKFEGKVEVKGTFRIEGEFKGTIETPDTLIIGKTGVVHATCKVKNAIVGGQLFGNIVADTKIELQSGSHLEGDIKTKRLVIDEGVFFEGNCSMGGNRQAAAAAAGSTGTVAAGGYGAAPGDPLRRG
jgi:cytoskeletal protein CcmA (bactofilin family)